MRSRFALLATIFCLISLATCQSSKPAPPTSAHSAPSVRHDGPITESAATQSSATHPAMSYSWPMFGGNPQRNRLMTGPSRITRRLWSAQLWPQTNIPQDRAAWVFPVIDRGQVYFLDGDHVKAVNVADGKSLWATDDLWPRPFHPGRTESASRPADQHLVSPFYSVKTPPSPQMLSITADAIVTTVGCRPLVPLPLSRPSKLLFREVDLRLACLERTDGKLRWIRRLSEVEPAARDDVLDAAMGPALVMGDQVFAAIAVRVGQFDSVIESWVICCDVHDGKVRWLRQIASWKDDARWLEPLDCPQPLASDAGRIFVDSDTGTVACLRAATGEIEWSSKYDLASHKAGPETRRSAWRRGVGRPLEVSSLMIRDGSLFASPRDSDSLLVADASTGKWKRIIPCRPLNDRLRPDLSSELPRMLFAGKEGLVVLASRSNVICVSLNEWKDNMDYWPASYWNSPLSVSGSPAIMRDWVMAATERAVVGIFVRTGKIMWRYPEGPSGLPADEPPGNLLLAPGYVIMAGARALNVYAGE